MLQILIFLSFSIISYGTTVKSICGVDNRISSAIKPLGRLRGRGYCTGTLISKSCMISAGHCVAKNNKRYVEFNVQPKSASGIGPKAKPEDVYRIDLQSVEFKRGGRGNDYAVFKLLKNDVTGKLPGDVQGIAKLHQQVPLPFSRIHIAGYGSMRSNPQLHRTQTVSGGSISSVTAELKHNVDTTPGASGAPVFMQNEIIGVHSHGGCSRIGYNSATSVLLNSAFAAAIEKCTSSE